MTLPNDMSIKGLGDWAEGAGDPPANSQHINADTVDNKHYADLKSDWQADIANSGGGVAAIGTASFAGAGTVVITIGITMPDTTYRVVISPLGASGYIGEWAISGKSTTQFGVTNTGSGTDTFEWAVLV